MRLRPFVLLLGLWTSGCALDVAPDGDVADVSAAIVNGEDNEGDPAVVALMRAGSVTCSGTLIGRSSVLTASHCVDLLPPEWIHFGPDPGSPTLRVRVSEVHMHPGYNRPTLAHDVAVITLERPVDIQPVPLPPYDVSEDDAGARVRIAGFGFPGGDSDGALRKRQGFARIATFEIDRFFVEGDPSQPCLGDSGGPSFMLVNGMEPIVGVHSGGNSECTGGAYEVRVGAHLPFIEAHVTTPYAAPAHVAGLEGSCSVSAVSPKNATAMPIAISLVVGLAFGRRRRRSSASPKQQHRQEDEH